MYQTSTAEGLVGAGSLVSTGQPPSQDNLVHTRHLQLVGSNDQQLVDNSSDGRPVVSSGVQLARRVKQSAGCVPETAAGDAGWPEVTEVQDASAEKGR